MSKQFKIKRSHWSRGGYKARPHPLFVVFMILLVGGLGYLGFIIYPPIHSAIMNWGETRSVETLPVPDDVTGAENGDPLPPAPPPTPPRSTDNIRAIYAPPALVNNEPALSAFLQSLPDAGINAVMVDIKDNAGQILHTSQHPQAAALTAEGAFDLGALSLQLEDLGLALIVRMSAFRDESAARAQPGWAVNFRGPGMLWLDNFPNMGGRPWLNPHSADARQYLIELSLEAVRLGAVMVVMDDFQFPPNSMYGQDAYFGDTGGMTRAERLRGFADELTDRLANSGARFAIYMTALTIASEPNTTFYGGPAEDILGRYTVLSALPYQFPFGFEAEGISLPNPLENLEYTLRQILPRITARIDSQPVVVLQGGSLPGGVQYTDEQVRSQVEILERLGVREFIFYAPYVGHYQVLG